MNIDDDYLYIEPPPADLRDYVRHNNLKLKSDIVYFGLGCMTLIVIAVVVILLLWVVF